MRILILLVLMIAAFHSNSFSSEIEDFSKNYLSILTCEETVKSENSTSLERKISFNQLLNKYHNENNALYLPIKDALLNILANDPSFFFKEISKYEGAYEFWKENFDFYSTKPEQNDFHELKSIIVKRLEIAIKTQEKILKLQKDALIKIKATPVEEID